MEYLMEKINEIDEPIWCDFIHYDHDSRTLVLEDLKVRGDL